MTENKSDEELMGWIQRGEEHAFTELYHRYSKPLVRYFHRMLWKDENKAQDFLQDLFLKILENPMYFNPDKKFSTWIYSVAHNMCKNEYRKQAYRKAVNGEIKSPELFETRIYDNIDQQNFMKALEDNMRHWEEDDRTMFVLRHELEMTFSDIASVLGCPEGTVKSRWFYLRKNLAGQFQFFNPSFKGI